MPEKDKLWITVVLFLKLDEILARGLCIGLGTPRGQMCIEAAICASLGEPHGDSPSCVAYAVRAFKIALNDSHLWASPESRARGLRDLGIAQLGSRGIVDDAEFARRLGEKTIRVLIPRLFRDLQLPKACQDAADICEIEGTPESAKRAAASAYAAGYATAEAAQAANNAACASIYAANNTAYASICAANAGIYAAYASTHASAANASETYLLLATSLALETLRELKSLGIEWI